MTADSRAAYESGEASWVHGLEPPDALALPAERVVEMLQARFGTRIDTILAGENRRPTALDRDEDWIRRTRMVGINVRTVGSFWRVVHYSLTLPSVYDSIHLLPIWEPGVVGSLYGMASWNLNGEFVDADLARIAPSLATATAQLEAVMAILHLQGRAVGMDMIPHTDRFSEIVLAEPDKFEWLRREGSTIVEHRSDLHLEVMEEIDAFLAAHGPAGADAPGSSSSVFSPQTPEDERLRLLFGPPADQALRSERRQELITHLKLRGYEPVPATMGPPYRGIEVDRKTLHTDDLGRSWCEYRITDPQPMSRVFGPLARYKFFDRLDDNAGWQIDFSRPRTEVFEYLARHVGAVQERYGFDFIRGDMSHVQMRPDGVPAESDAYYDPFRYVCGEIRRRLPGFPYFAESFLAPPGTMAFGDEVEHLEASRAEVTLGDLQSVPVGGDEFLPRLRRYLDIASARSVTPSFTVMTGDKDDPRFDSFYWSGNELRAFLSLLLPDLPSYTALGFELRDVHTKPAANEYYTKLYVFHETSGSKATSGPYRFGTNHGLFRELTRVREYCEQLQPDRDDRSIWRLPPDATAGARVIAWELQSAAKPNRRLLCVANTDTAGAQTAQVPVARECTEARLVFGTPARAEDEVRVRPAVAAPRARSGLLEVRALPPGACAVIDLACDTTGRAQ